MNWKLKASIQNTVARLPDRVSHDCYYWIQRRFGGLRCPDPRAHFHNAVAFINQLQRIGRSVEGAHVLEIGTGRRVNVPIALWLCGANRVTTVDLNCYLKEELIREDLNYMTTHSQEIEELFGDRICRHRLQELFDLTKHWEGLTGLLDLCCIDTLAPADATALPLPDGVVDYQVSLHVFEHIPGPVIAGILREGNRVLKADGVFLHRVDYSDHFSHSDPSLTPVNFLQYREGRWDKIAGNRYMYMNRIRVDDMVELFKDAGHEILTDDRDVDATIARAVAAGEVPLDDAFQSKDPAVIATTASWVASRKRRK